MCLEILKESLVKHISAFVFHMQILHLSSFPEQKTELAETMSFLIEFGATWFSLQSKQWKNGAVLPQYIDFPPNFNIK